PWTCGQWQRSQELRRTPSFVGGQLEGPLIQRRRISRKGTNRLPSKSIGRVRRSSALTSYCDGSGKSSVIRADSGYFVRNDGKPIARPRTATAKQNPTSPIKHTSHMTRAK